MKRCSGLTIIEVLLAGVILVILLGIVGQGIQSSSAAVGTVIVESELLEDTRVAGQMISDGIAKAVYVYPPGAILTLNKSNSWTVRNPRTNSNVWQVGLDPILAFIEAPENPHQNCIKTSSDKKGCLKFVSYYPINRSNFVKNDANGSYLENKQNSAAWVLFEYRRTLDVSELGIKPPPVDSNDLGAGSLNTVSGKILVDFLIPDTGFVPFTGEQVCRDLTGKTEHDSSDGTSVSVCDVFEQGNYNTNYLDGKNTFMTGQFELQAAFNKQRGSISQTPRMTFTIAPRNLY